MTSTDRACPSPSDGNLCELRERLENVARDFTREDHSWQWDETRMHLTISDVFGNPLATLHLEYFQ